MKINWRSLLAALSSALALLAALPYTLGEVATIIPPTWKPKVAVISITAAFILRVINSIDKPPPTTETKQP